jgi:hypothetical protein
MRDTKFWRILAVVVCLGLFYVGHGLHNRGGDPLPPFTNVAHAGGAVALSGGGWLYTTNQDGSAVHGWVVDGTNGKPQYMPSMSGTAPEGSRVNRPAQKP